MLRCSDLEAVIRNLHSCREVNGEARVTTHCLYPSFEPVVVSISRFGDGFHVHDDGGSCRESWLNGRDDPAISRLVLKEAEKLQVKFKKGVIFGNARTVDWLPSVVLAVANASAGAAAALLEQNIQSTETDLKSEIYRSLSVTLPNFNVKKYFPIRGKSGKEYDFDFGVFGNNSTILLVNAVIPHPNSIASKYLAFSDASETVDHEATAMVLDRRYHRFAVYDRPLAPDDASLMRQVSDLVPISALSQGAHRAFLRQ
ncbi:MULTISPECIES: hypothetical protein [unclassified Methylobacterium]|uniref:hypothetical protein n=1 Tax=unclassified Methylobacterium TaxID=2615210 RepID=UPI00226AD0A9|nr:MULTISPECIES: hypothetical protein [unclassified Methylobacterium]